MRFSFLVLAATGINMLGLALTEWLGWSLLFFDMIGTAFASMLGGAVAGLAVALASSFLGSVSTHDPSYLAYGYVNAVGALIWAVLPRTGRPIFGCYVFNLGSGATYRRAFWNILVLGVVAGLATSLAAWAITIPVLSGEGTTTYGAHTATGSNNGVLAENIIGLTHANLGVRRSLAVLLASAVTNIPDKIIATASAVILIISYRNLPNYKEQKKAIRHNNIPDGAIIVANRFILISICIGQTIIFPMQVYNITNNINQAGMMFAFSSIIAVLILLDPIYFRSVDRIYGKELAAPSLFYSVPADFHMGHHKAVFEDILKLMAIAVSGISFLLAMSGEAACVPESVESLSRCGPLYELAAVNALIVTGFRYACVVVMRMSNRH